MKTLTANGLQDLHGKMQEVQESLNKALDAISKARSALGAIEEIRIPERPEFRKVWEERIEQAYTDILKAWGYL